MSLLPPPPPSSRESLPSLTGLFEVLFELGHGGMGTVYLARMGGLAGFERLVVVKRMNRELTARKDSVRRFLNEAKIASFVHHANVVGVQVIGEDQDGYFLVLDYVEGESLDGLLVGASQRGERLPVSVILRIVMDGLAGLHAIHEARNVQDQPLGILHRDVSTCNLLVGADGVTRITDFGVAKSARDASHTGNLLVGKALYMAPEYLQQQSVDRRIDIYAMGILLYIALVGEDPWPDLATPQLMLQIVNRGVPRIPDGIVPPAIADVIATACAKDPGARFPTARAMARALSVAATGVLEIAEPIDVASVVGHVAGRRLQDRRRLLGRTNSRAMSSPSGPAATPVSSRGSPAAPATAAEVEAPTSLANVTLVIPVSERKAPPPESVPAEEIRPTFPPRETPVPRETLPPPTHATSATVPPPPLHRVVPRGVVLGGAALMVAAIAGAWALRSSPSTASGPATGVVAPSPPSASTPPPPSAASAPPSTVSADPPAKTKTGTKVVSTKAPPSAPPAPTGVVPGTIATGNPYR